MQTVPLETIRMAGCIDREVTPSGTVPHRYPRWARDQIDDFAFTMLEAMPAGIRIELQTDATKIEIDASVTVIGSGTGFTSSAFDLLIDGQLTSTIEAAPVTELLIDRFTGRVDANPGEPATIRFGDLPGDPSRLIEIWLPHAAGIVLHALRLSDGATFRQPQRGRPRWVHYGSSISHCAEARRPTATWPAIVALRAGLDLTNLAVAGECMLDQFAARTISELEADLISIKAGINIVNADLMRERAFVPTLHGFLDTIRAKHEATPIVVTTPLICPQAERHPGPTIYGTDGQVHVVDRPNELMPGALTLTRVRALVGTVIEQRRSRGDPNLWLVDGLELFGADDVGLLHDGLHPTEAGYTLIADRFYEHVVGERRLTANRQLGAE